MPSLRRLTDRIGGFGNDSVVPSDIGERVQTDQLRLLDSAAWGAIGNVIAVLVVAHIARAELSALLRAAWLAAMTVSIAGLLFWVAASRPHRASLDGAATAKRIRQHVFFATLIGACWGLPSLFFGGTLTLGHLLIFAVTVLSATAACCAALGVHLPSFWGFCLAALLPLALALFRRPGSEAEWLGFLVLIYIPTLGGVVFAYNRSALSAFRLRAENEALARSLAASQADTAAATRSKWDTLAHLSHELRTPMNAIIGFSEAMQQQLFGPLSPRYRAYSGDIHTSGRYALDLIDAIFDVSRGEAGQILLAEETIDTGPFIEECLRMVEAAAADRHIALACRADALPPLVADRAKLRQTLLNLLTNAIKYTPIDGQVSIEARSDDDGIDIAVSDTGIGIDAADLARCQEPFVRLSNPLTNAVAGAGLGLPIAKRLIEAHGGSMTLASKPRQGTRVTVHLPASRLPPRADLTTVQPRVA